MSQEQEGKCIDVSVPGAIPNWFGAPVVKLDPPTQAGDWTDGNCKEPLFEQSDFTAALAHRNEEFLLDRGKIGEPVFRQSCCTDALIVETKSSCCTGVN